MGEKKNLKGVAVYLKELLRALDEKLIPHDDERSIRRKLRKRVDVKTTASQFFLKEDREIGPMESLNRQNSSPHSCVIIPRADVPQEFFEVMENKGK